MSTSETSLPETCPHLGSAVDGDTRFAYPSAGNWCYRVASPEGISLAHQQRYCVSGEYESCPIFSQGGERLPRTIRQSEGTLRSGKTIPWQWLVTVSVVVLVLAGFLMTQRGQGTSQEVVTASLLLAPSATHTALPTASPTATAPVVALATRTPTSLTPQPPTATFTLAPPTMGPALETPFGPQAHFLVHKVGVGESLTAIANRYGTTVEVLRAINVFVPGATLWAGQTLVVMPGVTVVPDDVPPLLPVYVERDTALSVLAQQHAVTVEALRAYNALGEHDFIPGGRWVLIPQTP